METFNSVFLRECLAIVKELSSHNQIQTLKLVMCNKEILQQISKFSKLSVLEIMEATVCSKLHRPSFQPQFSVVERFRLVSVFPGRGQTQP